MLSNWLRYSLKFLFLFTLVSSSFFAFSQEFAHAKSVQKKRIIKRKIQSNKGATQDFLKTKTAQAILKRQGKRMRTIDGMKKKGVLGEAETGLLKIRTTKGLKGVAAKKVKELIEQENKDRERLFSGVARAQGMSEDLKKKLRFNMFTNYKMFDPQGVYFFQGEVWQKK